MVGAFLADSALDSSLGRRNDLNGSALFVRQGVFALAGVRGSG